MHRRDFLQHVDAFLNIYPNRPLLTNSGGMGMNHCFGLFAVLRHVRPSLVVESGVWRGQSTWVIEQAVPEAEIVCIDPSPDQRVYTASSASYLREDFAAVDWTDVNPTDAVCFFDDHQNAYARLMEMR